MHYFKNEYFNDSNLLIFSADNAYYSLPKEVKDKLTKAEYESIKKDDFKVLHINKAKVLIVKR